MITATLQATSMQARAAARSRPRQLVTALPAPRPWRAVPARTSVSHMRPQGLGQDAVGSWLDLASFVALSKSTKTPYDDLATKIGEDIFLDVGGWHLYLRDAKLAPGSDLTLAQGLAAQLALEVAGPQFSSDELHAVLKRVPVQLGAGRATVPLLDLLPPACVRSLEGICVDYGARR